MTDAIFAPPTKSSGGTQGDIYMEETPGSRRYVYGSPEDQELLQRVQTFMGLLCEDREAGRILTKHGYFIGPNEMGLLGFIPTRPQLGTVGQRGVEFVREPYILALFESCGLRMWGIHVGRR